MKGQDLFRLLGEVDDEFILEAEEMPQKVKKRPFSIWKVSFVAAAVVLMVFYAGQSLVNMDQQSAQDPGLQETATSEPPSVVEPPALPATEPISQEPEQAVNPDLPVLKLEGWEVSGLGFEGYTIRDAEDLPLLSPWRTDWNLTELPVYRNRYLQRDTNGDPIAPDELAMRSRIIEIATVFGYSEEDLDIGPMNPEMGFDEMIRRKDPLIPVPMKALSSFVLEGKGDGISILITPDLSLSIHLDKEVSLPIGTRSDYSTEKEFASAVGEYLLENYAEDLGIKNPILDVNRRFNFDGTEHFSPIIRSGFGDWDDQLINYTFSTLRYHVSDEGDLTVLHLSTREGLDPVGVYPLIDLEKAKQMLIDGEYFSVAPVPFPGVEQILKVEIAYRRDYSTVYIPYYVFYVEIEEDEMAHEGLRSTAVYYVPAVDPAYLDLSLLEEFTFN
ncbi:MAG: hypothetical protein Q4G61_05650 [Tissierellia bacterium]|nr:hypothetical protein [Tissierellia bacterium]